jgi:hypothetical protein
MLSYPENLAGIRIFFNKSLALGLIVVLLAIGLVSITVASTSTSEQVSPQAQRARLRSITYTLGTGSPQTLDLSNPYISIENGAPLFLTVKGESTGPTSQKGYMFIYNLESLQYQNAIQITPGKVSTLKANPPLIWHWTGDYAIDVGIYPPSITNGQIVHLIVTVY